MTLSRRALLAGAAVTGASACAPSLGTYNRLIPNDPGGLRVVQSAHYAPGPRQTLDLYSPATISAMTPLIVFFYGGSWNSGRKEDYSFVADAFTARGFRVCLPDYRIAPDVFPSFLEDCAASVRWCRDHARNFGADIDTIILAGHSAGAYNAIMLALDAHYLADAGVPAAAIKGAAGLAGPYDFYPYDVDSTRAAFGTAPDPQLTQPMHFVHNDAPPLWLGWGEDDKTVRRKSIDHLAAAVTNAGGKVETKIYPHVGHVGLLLALSRPFRGRASARDDIADFARRAATL